MGLLTMVSFIHASALQHAGTCHFFSTLYNLSDCNHAWSRTDCQLQGLFTFSAALQAAQHPWNTYGFRIKGSGLAVTLTLLIISWSFAPSWLLLSYIVNWREVCLKVWAGAPHDPIPAKWISWVQVNTLPPVRLTEGCEGWRIEEEIPGKQLCKSEALCDQCCVNQQGSGWLNVEFCKC